MKRLKYVLAACVAALTVSTGALAAVPSMNEDGGGSYPYEVWIEVSMTYDSTGFPIFLYCRYGTFPWGTEQLGCWT